MDMRQRDLLEVEYPGYNHLCTWISRLRTQTADGVPDNTWTQVSNDLFKSFLNFAEYDLEDEKRTRHRYLLQLVCLCHMS
jgi:hypothetical protein